MPFACYCDRQSTSHALYLRRFAFARTQPDKLVYLHPDCQPTRTAMRPPSSFRTLCARHIRNFAAKAHTRPLLPLTLPLDTLFCLFRLPLFPQAVQRSAFLCVLVSCGTYVLSSTKTSTFIGIFTRLCIFIHCDIACFSLMRLLLPSLRSFSHCRSAADDRASAPLLHPVPHPAEVARVPSHRFAFAFSFRDRVSRPPFSRSLFISYLR